jgi:hypothetical protein
LKDLAAHEPKDLQDPARRNYHRHGITTNTELPRQPNCHPNRIATTTELPPQRNYHHDGITTTTELPPRNCMTGMAGEASLGLFHYGNCTFSDLVAMNGESPSPTRVYSTLPIRQRDQRAKETNHVEMSAVILRARASNCSPRGFVPDLNIVV